MATRFICTVCGRERGRRSHFLWVAAVVAAFYGSFIPPNGPVCVECAPKVATLGGRLLYGLIVIGILFLIFHGIPHTAVK
jgi:hypothetical protein